jgi:hypothetical protein
MELRSKLVAGTYGNQSLLNESGIEWIDTAITYNNDYLLSDYKGKIISKISPVMLNNYDFWVDNHLKCLNRDSIDIMLVHNARFDDWLPLYGKIREDKRFKEVGVSNVDIYQLNKLYNRYKEYPTWVELEINPEYIPYAIIEYCKNRGIKLIAYAILGGEYNSKKYIREYTLPYLIKLADELADKVIVRWTNKVELDEIKLISDPNSEFLNFEIDTNFSNFNKSIVPDIYIPPKYVMTLDGFPIYDKLRPGSVTTLNNFDYTKFDLYLNYLRLEFISEYQAFIRYMDMNMDIAILDGYGKLTKVVKEDYKIINKWK